MSGSPISPSAWSQIISLGEQLFALKDFVQQQALILETAQSLFHADGVLWLDRRLFHLPGPFPSADLALQIPDTLMQQALQAAEGLVLSPDGRQAAVAFRAQQREIGALSLLRPNGPPWGENDLELLRGFAAHVSLALFAAHRIAVEEWRLQQLTLVRTVSAQLANILDLKTLARRVSRLILETFQYYYVAIFTVEPGQEYLSFLSSASAQERRGMRSARLTRIRPGQGLIGTAALTGEEIISNNVDEEPRFRFLEVLPGTRSEVVLPLKIESRILGVLDIQSDQENAFHPNDLLVLRSLADTIAVAINRIRLYSDLQRRLEQLDIVAAVSKKLVNVLELDALLKNIAEIIAERLRFPYVHLFTVHLNRRRIIYEAGSGARSEAFRGYSLSLDQAEGIIPWVARNGQSVLANDVHLDPRYRPSPFPPDDTRSELTIPLMYNQQVVGVLDIQSNRKNAFEEGDRFVLEALADTIALAIRNAELFRTERWRRQVTESLREVAGRLMAMTTVDDVLDAILRELERNLPCDASGIWLFEGEELYPARLHGVDLLDVQAMVSRWPETLDSLYDLLNAPAPVIRKPTDAFGPLAMALGFPADHSSIGVALRVGERPLGVLVLSHRTPGRYGHEAQALTATFAGYAAVVIENARLYDSVQEQAYASAALLQVAQTVSSSLDLQQTLEAIVRMTPILVGVEASALYLWQEGRFTMVSQYGFSNEQRRTLFDRPFAEGEFPLLDAARQLLRPVVGVIDWHEPAAWLEQIVATSEQEEYYLLQAAERLFIAFPLSIKNDFYGVLLVEDGNRSRRFRRRRIEILTGVAQQVALSIQNEHLQREMVLRERLEHEVQLARQIQRAFLPESLPRLPGWELEAVWRTARQVGGDFYDVFELPNRQLGLFIADVSDKGIPAALFMALTRTLVRAAVADSASPAMVMQRVNELLIPDNRQGMFVTAVYALLDLESGRLTFANAGHNPPMVIRAADRTIEKLERTGPALGILEEADFQERVIHLDQGDVLFLYTDGVTDAQSVESEFFGEERLCTLLRSECTAPVERLLQVVETAVNQFTAGCEVFDDLTMLALKRAE